MSYHWNISANNFKTNTRVIRYLNSMNIAQIIQLLYEMNYAILYIL